MDDGDNYKLLHLDWAAIQLLVKKLAERIEKSRFDPDVLIAISRGGFDPARLLSDHLGIRRIASIQIEYYSSIKNTKKEPEIIFPLNANVKGLKTLIVDDVSDSGNSLIVARKHVAQGESSDNRTATLHIKPWTIFKPDYYVEEVDSWIVYPWEYIETIKDIADKIRRKKNYASTQLRTRLIELGFKEELVKKLVGN
jgi:hypoxanthine phosphoribosyltransferase